MNNTRILEMLNAGRIEELKKTISDEIYAESLKAKPGAKKRYTAMKKYFTYYTSPREVLQKPCPVEFEGETYISFCNSWSLAMTKEDCGEIEMFNTENGNYPDVVRLLRFDGIKKKIDFNKIFAKARSEGYRLNKSEVGLNFKYLFHYDGAYYKVGLLEATFGIIDDGSVAISYHPDGYNMPLTIKNNLGICMVMPMRFEGDPEDDGHIVIELDE